MGEVATLALALEVPLERFSLRLELEVRGRALAIAGPSGSGKTTLLDALCGLRRSARGRIALNGRTLLDSAARVHLPPERRRIGYVPQDALLFPHLTAEENVRFGLRGAEAERRFREAVEIAEVGALLAQYPATLSGGERQRVALARALASGPEMLALDEPLAALDLELKSRILPYLLRVRDEARVPLLYVTHHWGEARLLADEALLLREGQAVDHGPAARVLAVDAFARLEPAESLENVVDGLLEADARGEVTALRVTDTLRLSVPAQPASDLGKRGTFALPADDVLISSTPLQGISARNVLAGKVEALTDLGPDLAVKVDASGVGWTAKLTHAAAAELKLSPGSPAWLVIKTHSFRRLR